MFRPELNVEATFKSYKKRKRKKIELRHIYYKYIHIYNENINLQPLFRKTTLEGFKQISFMMHTIWMPRRSSFVVS